MTTDAPRLAVRELPGALRIEGVTKRYGTVVALDDVTLEVPAGWCVALVGESGSGKTTLLRTFNKMVRPDQGRVFVDGADVAPADPVKLRRRIGYVPQDGGLMPHWRVQRNVELVPWLRDLPDRRRLATAALELVGLSPGRFGARWPTELSGGQRQRVAIARALAARPNVILLDEPFGALDAITRAELQQALLDLRRELQLTILLVTHDLREASRLGDAVAVMRGGRLEQVAPPAELLAAPATGYVRELLHRAGVHEGIRL